jgi:hypothetical protein
MVKAAIDRKQRRQAFIGNARQGLEPFKVGNGIQNGRIPFHVPFNGLNGSQWNWRLSVKRLVEGRKK